jgi:hypothetical protein
MPDIHDRQPFRAPDVAPRTGVSDDEAAAVRLANRFDIRRIIAGVFTVYGLVLLALGVFGAQHIKDKASGINVDLWTGAGMLVVGAAMLAWALLRPVRPEPREMRGQGSGGIRRTPAT